MIFGAEIGLAIAGLIALFAGKLPLSNRRFISGVPARLLGLVALAPIPVAFALHFVFGFQAGLEGRELDAALKTKLLYTEAGLVVGCALIVFGVGFLFSEEAPALSKLVDPDDEPALANSRDEHDAETMVKPFNAKAIFTFKSDRKYRVYGDADSLYFIHLAGQWDIFSNLSGIDPEKVRDMDRTPPKHMVGNHAHDFTVPIEEVASARIDAPSFWGGHGKHVGSWQLVLNDGTKWNLQFEDMIDMKRAIASLAELLRDRIDVHAKWDEEKQKYR